MFRKKHPVLTAHYCSHMENLRAAIEVLTGKRTTFICLDFNTGRAKIRIGEDVVEPLYYEARSDLIRFNIGTGWAAALLGEDGLMRVGISHNLNTRKTVAGEFQMRWVGRSATDRREEPLFPEQAVLCAEKLGVTVEQLLNP